jgi:branched-chain amino acid transport system permease protein
LSILILQALASGIVTGCVYALLALAVVIIFKSTDVVNFAGGELMMLGAYVGLFAIVFLHLDNLVMVVLAVAAVFVVGAAFERITLNRIAGERYARHAELVPLVVATIGLSFLLKGGVRVVPYTEEVRRLPPMWSGPPIFIGDIVLQRQDLVIVAAATLVMLALTWFFRFTSTGKALRATSQNPRAAALIGIPVRRMRMLAWGIASAISGLAGVLIAPKLLMTPDMGLVVMLAFAAAIIGGFTSLAGCVVGGILLGILQNFVGILLLPQAISVTPFFVIMIVLMLRPEGMFGERIAKKM